MSVNAIPPEAEQMIKRIAQNQKVAEYLIASRSGVPIRSTFEESVTQELAQLVLPFLDSSAALFNSIYASLVCRLSCII